jgi:DNA-binding NarL/FixJ family response regulator
MTDFGAARERGLAAFERGKWGEAYVLLTTADNAKGLGPSELQVLAEAAYLLGRDDETIEALERAHHVLAEGGHLGRAATCAFWLGLTLLIEGQPARAAGWFRRQERLLDQTKSDPVDRGYGFLGTGLRNQSLGRFAEAAAEYRDAADIGDRCGDVDLAALGRDGQGEVLIAMGKVEDGLLLLDEAMVAVLAGEVTPKSAGIIYCGVVEACLQAFDLSRAQEWTWALGRWCDDHPEMVPYRGQCLVRRSEVMRLHAQWPEAADQASQACQLLTTPRIRAEAGTAFYQRAELFRLKGEWGEAEKAYRQAHEYGRSPQPGLALLRLFQGKLDDALGMIRSSGEGERDEAKHVRLAARVEIMLAAAEVEEARAAADQLEELASRFDRPLLNAMSAHASGAVLMSEGDIKGSIQALQRSRTLWQSVEAPYEAARSGILLAQALRREGDPSTAQLEEDAARRTFSGLGARSDLAVLNRLSRVEGPLTERERQVLAGVVEGKTNREIANDLFVSVHTVRRHLQNIFPKLAVSSRAAAAAHAVRHHLI